MEAPERRGLPPGTVRKTNSVLTTATNASTVFSERHPYLDLIATSQHLPDRSIGDEQWRRSLVQPVCIPSLAHTGIRSMFDSEHDPVMRPDGLMSEDFKESIHKHMFALPKLPMYIDDRDIKRRDRDRTSERAVLSARRTPEMGERPSGIRSPSSMAPTSKAPSSPHQPQPQPQPEGMTATLGLRTRLVDSHHRLKRPYSDTSLFRSLMDFHYNPPSEKYQWEVKGLTYELHT